MAIEKTDWVLIIVIIEGARSDLRIAAQQLLLFWWQQDKKGKGSLYNSW